MEKWNSQAGELFPNSCVCPPELSKRIKVYFCGRRFKYFMEISSVSVMALYCLIFKNKLSLSSRNCKFRSARMLRPRFGIEWNFLSLKFCAIQFEFSNVHFRKLNLMSKPKGLLGIKMKNWIKYSNWNPNMFSDFLSGDFVLIEHHVPLGFKTLTIFETETRKVKCLNFKYFVIAKIGWP